VESPARNHDIESPRPISKLVGGAIGLTKDYQAHQKEQKATHISMVEHQEDDVSQVVPVNNPPSSAEPAFRRDDFSGDEGWIRYLDQIQNHEVSGTSSQNVSSGDIENDHFLRDLIARHQLPNELRQGPLPMAVILTQRRRESRQRGVVHAFAPILDASAINQET
jgi:hypothetical protein